MADGNRNPEQEVDPEKLAKLLEMELMQKRAGWQQGKQRRNTLRLISFFFLFVVIAGALVAFFFLFSRDRFDALRAGHENTIEATPSPSVSPH